jgi:hypothetical protein
MFWKFNNTPDKTFEFTTFERSKIAISQKKEDELFLKYINGKEPIITRKDKEGRYFSIIKLNTKVSSIASRLLDKFHKLSYIIIINDYDKEKTKVSIRSKSVNLLEYQGTAGHEHACGITEISDDWIEDLWRGKIYCLEKRVDLEANNMVDLDDTVITITTGEDANVKVDWVCRIQG